MRILVTGGAGFIASRVAEAYIEDGHEVAVLDDLSSGRRENLPAKAAFYQGDVGDSALVDRVFRQFRPRVVSHHAAQLDVRRSLEDPAHDAQVNVLGGLNVLLHAVKHGAVRFLFASTGGAIYGDPAQLPVTESAPARPESPYGLSKATFESYLRIWWQVHGIVPVVLRYANVYGPRQSPHGEAGVVAVFSERLLRGEPCTVFGDGTSARDYVYVDDVVEANRLALARGDGQQINVGTGTLTTVREVYDVIRDAVTELADFGADQPLPPVEPAHEAARPGEVYRSCLSNVRAAELLGWRPRTTFRAGVYRTVAWRRQELRARLAGDRLLAEREEHRAAPGASVLSAGR